ncbi:MAG: DUF5674 family protein [Patescibacteria group bacterium]
MEILIVKEPISADMLHKLAAAWHVDLVKGVADIEKGVIALGGEWHIDANNVLISAGSVQKDIWGFNIYPEKRGDEAIEYFSLINIRPIQNNRGMEVESKDIQKAVRTVARQCMPYLEL